MLNVIVMSVGMLNVIMLSVIMLSVVMLSVMAPLCYPPRPQRGLACTNLREEDKTWVEFSTLEVAERIERIYIFMKQN